MPGEANSNQAKSQALDYFPGLKDAEYPRYILISDFQNFELYDLEEGTEQHFNLAQLPQRVESNSPSYLVLRKRPFATKTRSILKHPN